MSCGGGHLGFPIGIKKPDRHDIAEIVLKVALNTINNKPNAHGQFLGVGQATTTVPRARDG
jgi:hypothetical protein